MDDGVDADKTFELGQVWTTRGGYIYKVVEMLDWNDGDNHRKAVLRKGMSGTGKKHIRLATATKGWTLNADTSIR